VTSFGENLRQAREARNITLLEIAAATKIGSRSLKALEDEQFDQLPGGIFNKGFVRAYARYVGVDEEKAVAGYMEAAKATAPETDLEAMSAQVAAAAKRESSGFNAASVVGVLALLVALGLGGLWLQEHRREAREQEAARAAAVQEAQTPAPVPVVPPSAAPDASAVNPAQDATQGSAASSPETGAAPAADPGAKASASQSMDSRAGSEPVEVSIQATQRAWISVRSDGKTVESVTLDPDNPELRTRSYKAKDRLLLVIGNPAGLTVTYNGKPAGTLGTEGHRTTIAFTPQGIERP
jgi:cytoskeleton protein RodZ